MKKEKNEVKIEPSIEIVELTVSPNISHIIIVGDIHAGMYSNSYEKHGTLLEFFDEILIKTIKTLQDAGNEVCVIFEGDMFDIKQQVSTVIQNSLIDKIETIGGMCETIVNVGNHDMPIASNPNINSVKFARYMKGVTLADVPTYANISGYKICVVPYTNTKEKEKEILTAIYEKYGKINLALHTEIAGFHYEGVPVDESKHNSIEDFSMFAEVFSGHIHKRQLKANITFTGTPYHIRQNESGNEVGITIKHIKTGETEFIENKLSPRYIVVDYSYFEDLEEADKISLISNNYLTLMLPYAVTKPIDKRLVLELYSKYTRTISFSSRIPKTFNLSNTIDTKGIDKAMNSISTRDILTSYFKNTMTFKVNKHEYVIQEEAKRDELRNKILTSYENYKHLEE